MGAHKGFGHTACGDAEGLHYECPKNEGQYEGGYQPFEGICNLGSPVFSAGVLIFDFFNAGFGHKRKKYLSHLCLKQQIN
jgi:hypothetical protein